MGMLSGLPLKSGDSVVTKVKALRDLVPGDNVLLSLGVIETVTREPSLEGGMVRVGVTNSASFGPLVSDYADALVLVVERAGFMQGMNL